MKRRDAKVEQGRRPRPGLPFDVLKKCIEEQKLQTRKVNLPDRSTGWLGRKQRQG